MKSILLLALGLVKTVILGFEATEAGIVVKVRPHKSRAGRCPVCGAKCTGYDSAPEPRRWRAMDLGQSMCWVEYAVHRVRCPEHGVRVEAVPWARHGARSTRAFEDYVAWCAVHMTMSAAAELCRIEWRSVGGICARVWAEAEAARGAGRFDGLRRIGIDETSYKKGHRYITVVVDHDTGRLVWAHEGYGKDVLSLFLAQLTRAQRRSIEVVTADGAKWIKELVKRECPNARWVMDPFHVVQWMNDALDEIRREQWQAANRAYKAAAPSRRKGPGRPRSGEGASPEAAALKAEADAMKGLRWALLKNGGDLTAGQLAKLEGLRAGKSKAARRMLRAWELKEDLRAVFAAESGAEARALLNDWIHYASRCRIEQVVAVEKKVLARREDIVAAVELGISNARVEAVNNKIKVTVRMGYGFRNVGNLVALLMLRCSDVRPALPGREPKPGKRTKSDTRRESHENAA